MAGAFLYYVSMTGVTGSKGADLASAAERAGALQRELGGPLALGFGVKTKRRRAHAWRRTRTAWSSGALSFRSSRMPRARDEAVARGPGARR